MSHGHGIFSRYFQDLRNKQSIRYLHGKRVLDVGCNNGYLRTLLPKDIEYVGIDVQRFPDIDFTFYQRSVDDDLSDLEQFDTIFMLATIEHLEHYESSMRNLMSSLREGGVIILTTPTKWGDDMHHWGAKVGLTSQMAAEDHEKIFDLEELRQLLSKLGLEVTAAHHFFFGMNQLIVGRKK